VRLNAACPIRSGSRNESSASGRRRKRKGLSDQRATPTTSSSEPAATAAANTYALVDQLTCGSHGEATSSITTSASTSKIRSTTTVAASSARDEPDERCRATTRAASPARAGRTLLKKYPTRSALVVAPSGGRCSGGSSDC